MCMEPDFIKALLKEPAGLSKYVKFLINYRGRKLENCYFNTESKFFEQRIKERLNTQFNYYC